MLAAYHWNWGAPPGFGDHAQYLAHARALVEGRSYTDIGYIYHPAAPMLGPRAYPPGLPLTLAPAVAIAGVDSPLNKALMVMSVLLLAFVVYRRFAQVIAPWQAALATGLAALALESSLATTIPLSDLGFCALLWGLVLAVDTTTKWTWRRIVLITSLGFAAMSYRVPGVVVVPALALYALITWRDHRGRAAIPIAVWTVAGLAALATNVVDVPFQAYLLPRLDEIADRFSSMSRVYRAALFDLELYPFPWDKANDTYHAAASLALFLGAAALLWRYRRSMLTATVVTYVALLIMSPVSDGRYLWPLYPILAAGLIIGATSASRAATRSVRWYPRTAAPVAAALGVVVLVVLSRELARPASPSFDRLPDARSLFAWMRERNTRQPMRAMFVNPRVLALETRVAAMGALTIAPHLQMQAIRERELTHIVWQNAETNACRARLLNALARIYADRFELEYQNSTFRVYRVLDSGAALVDEHGPSFAVTPEICRQLPPF